MLKDALGAYRGTAREISRIIMEHPESAEAWYDRANVRSSCGDFHGAVGDYTMALQRGLRFRESITAYGNRGIAKSETGDFEGAIADFSEIIQRNPSNGMLLRSAYRERSLVKYKKGDWKGAADDRKMAVLLSVETTTT